jgi:hypothetical protein
MKYLIRSLYLLIFILFSCADGVRVATIRDNNWSYYDQMPTNARQSSMPNQKGETLPPWRHTQEGGLQRKNNFIARQKYKQIANERKNEYYRPQAREKKKPALKFTTPDTFYVAESKSDETVFLEDVEFDKIIDKNGKKFTQEGNYFLKTRLQTNLFQKIIKT